MHRILCTATLVTVLLMPTGLWAHVDGVDDETEETKSKQPQKTSVDELSLDELLRVEVTSIGRKTTKVSKVAGAVYVLTQEDIRRSGATTVPDALRLVPGLQVAHIDANKWAISARGFNGQYANKLLVMVDGRSVYTPLFSGVYWDSLDMVLDDIDRIEVIRGPGASLWGANAVNGIISIITKKADKTEGMLLGGGAGREELGFAQARYGGNSGEDLAYRGSVKYSKRDESLTNQSLQGAGDDWDALYGGARVDWKPSERDDLSFIGNLYRGNLGSTRSFGNIGPGAPTAPFEGIEDLTEMRSMNVLSRWNRDMSPESNLALQFYYDHWTRVDALSKERRETFDVDYQQEHGKGRHDFMWGANVRVTTDDLGEDQLANFVPSTRTDDLYGTFIQDEMSFNDGRFLLTLGSKFEHNNYTGFEVQPSARMSWQFAPDQTLWGSVSRAVRTPARYEHTFQLNTAQVPLPGGQFGQIRIVGNPSFTSEDLLAYELGYRSQVGESFSVDVAAFYNQYDNISTIEAGAPFVEFGAAGPQLVLPQLFGNLGSGKGYGTEISLSYIPFSRWKLTGWYTWMKLDVDLDATSSDTSLTTSPGQNPENQFQLRSYLELPGDLELDGVLHYVDELPSLNVEAYTRLDLRFAWHFADQFELSVTGQNLLSDSHPEFIAVGTLVVPTRIQRAMLVKVIWQY